MPEKKQHDRKIEALVLAGLIALKRALQAAFVLKLLQLTTHQIIVESDRRRVLAVLQSELAQRIDTTGPIYQVMLESIAKAGPDVIEYETSVTDEFGLILPTRLARAKNLLMGQVNSVLINGVSKETPRNEVGTEIFQILSKHSGFKRVMAYDTARAYNLQLLSALLRSNVDYIRIQLSEEHEVTDICDGLVGVFPMSEITDAPYRRLPPFHPFCKCYVLPFRS